MDKEERDRIFEERRRLVYFILNKHFSSVKGQKREDAAQEGLLCLYEIIDKCDSSRGSDSSYYYKSIQGRIRDYLRSERRHEKHGISFVPLDIESENGEIKERYVGQDLNGEEGDELNGTVIKFLNSCVKIGRLNELHVEWFYLRHLEDKTFEEIAGMYSTYTPNNGVKYRYSVNTIKEIVSRVSRKIRRDPNLRTRLEIIVGRQ